MPSRSKTNKKATTPKQTDRPNNIGWFASSPYSTFHYYATHPEERAAASARFHAMIASSKTAKRNAR